MIDALRNPPAALKAGVLRSLKGVHLSFTGILSRRRDAGLKLMEIKRLREKGQRITLLNERQFWLLAGNKADSTRADARGRARKRRA